MSVHKPLKKRQKILLDTDIGSDIDDAVCLAYLLANPMCDLLGISIVTGEAELRARLASALCKPARSARGGNGCLPGSIF
jgi:inosine-uridine nucleoside N-ribohydrolase